MAEYEKRGYLLENFRLFHLRSDGETNVDFHYHEFCKVLLLVSGRGGYSVEGHRYLLNPGDVMLIGSRSVHRPELEPGVPYERIILYVSADYLQQMSTPDCDLLSVFSGREGHVLRPREAQRRQLFALAAALERDLAPDNFGREILSHASLLRLMVGIAKARQDTASTLPSPVLPENRRVREIIRYLDENLSEDIDIEQLAEKFFVSKFYMMRQFRKETGTTIYLYLTQRRLIHARELIASGMSATQACYACGFRNYSSFTRAYSKHFGTTPTGRADAKLIREEGYE